MLSRKFDEAVLLFGCAEINCISEDSGNIAVSIFKVK
jgi:hypothetical protein